VCGVEQECKYAINLIFVLSFCTPTKSHHFVRSCVLGGISRGKTNHDLKISY
jgi:hypothetical protein